MPNRNYQNGAAKERRVVNAAREDGLVAFRSAGSHSPIDVVIIDHNKKEIKLVQCKPKSMSENAKRKIFLDNKFLEGHYHVSFSVE